MDARKHSRIRWGALALIGGGLLGVIGELLRGPLLDPAANPAAFATTVTSPNFALAWILILLAAILSIFGTLAVFAFLAGSRVDGMAFWGAMLSVLGGCLFLIFTGSFAFAFPVLGRLLQAGDQGALQVARASFFTGAATGILYPSGLIGTVGSILLGIAIWRSTVLSKWAGLLFAIHTPLLAFAPAFSYPLEIVGGLSLLVGGIWLALGMWHGDATMRKNVGTPTMSKA